jgi:hypothetical protein
VAGAGITCLSHKPWDIHLMNRWHVKWSSTTRLSVYGRTDTNDFMCFVAQVSPPLRTPPMRLVVVTRATLASDFHTPQVITWRACITTTLWPYCRTRSSISVCTALPRAVYMPCLCEPRCWLSLLILTNTLLPLTQPYEIAAIIPWWQKDAAALSGWQVKSDLCT